MRLPRPSMLQGAANLQEHTCLSQWILNTMPFSTSTSAEGRQLGLKGTSLVPIEPFTAFQIYIVSLLTWHLAELLHIGGAAAWSHPATRQHVKAPFCFCVPCSTAQNDHTTYEALKPYLIAVCLGAAAAQVGAQGLIVAARLGCQALRAQVGQHGAVLLHLRGQRLQRPLLRRQRGVNIGLRACKAHQTNSFKTSTSVKATMLSVNISSLGAAIHTTLNVTLPAT